MKNFWLVAKPVPSPDFEDVIYSIARTEHYKSDNADYKKPVY
jgi:hypothetical protein